MSKPRGYTVRINSGHVSVEHRASIRPVTLVVIACLYVGYCFLPAIRRVLNDAFQSHDPVVIGFALFFLLLPCVGAATWVVFRSGEVFLCDSKELQFAYRRTLGRWHRRVFPLGKVRKFQWMIYGGPKRRTYPVLSFECEGKVYRILEELDREEGIRILRACEGLGFDCVIPEVFPDHDGPMNADIEKRGWFVNPWKSDGAEASSKELR